MCKSSTEPGGAKRCSSHAKIKYDELKNQIDATVESYQNVELLTKVINKFENNPSMFDTKKKQRKVIAALANRILDNDEDKQKFVEAYDETLKEQEELVRAKNAFHDELYIRKHGSLFQGEPYPSVEWVATHNEFSDEPNMYNRFASKIEPIFNTRNAMGSYFDARAKFINAEIEYLGTTKGISEALFDTKMYNKKGEPTEELLSKISMAAKSSKTRHKNRMAQFQDVRNRSTDPDNDPVVKQWEKAFKDDPTLEHSEQYKFVSKTADSVTLAVTPTGITSKVFSLVTFSKKESDGVVKYSRSVQDNSVPR